MEKKQRASKVLFLFTKANPLSTLKYTNNYLEPSLKQWILTVINNAIYRKTKQKHNTNNSVVVNTMSILINFPW